METLFSKKKQQQKLYLSTSLGTMRFYSKKKTNIRTNIQIFNKRIRCIAQLHRWKFPKKNYSRIQIANKIPDFIRTEKKRRIKILRGLQKTQQHHCEKPVFFVKHQPVARSARQCKDFHKIGFTKRIQLDTYKKRWKVENRFQDHQVWPLRVSGDTVWIHQRTRNLPGIDQ